jgi:hypothetical protein
LYGSPLPQLGVSSACPAVGVDLDYVWDLPEDYAHANRWVYLFLLDLLQVVVNAPKVGLIQNRPTVTQCDLL